MSKSKSKRKFETEWSFNFGDIGQSISDSLDSLGITDDVEVKTSSFTEALAEATQARVVLEPAIGELHVTTLSDSENLFEADVTYVGEVKYEVQPQGSGRMLKLRHHLPRDVFGPIKDALGSFTRRKELQWAVRLTPDIPLDLQFNTGVTKNTLDLSALQVASLAINGGTGKTDLRLPTMGGEYPVQINSGTGSIDVDIPDGALVDLNLNKGTGRTQVNIGAGASVKAHLTGGVGKCQVRVPAAAALRIRLSTGLGKIQLPDHVQPVKVDQFIATSGTWQTEGYDEAEHQIDIRYEGGVGGFSLETV